MSSNMKAKNNDTMLRGEYYNSLEFEKKLNSLVKNANFQIENITENKNLNYKNIKKFGIKYGLYPFLYEVASSIGTAYPIYKNLRLRQEQMKKANIIGGDNYSHRLGMCEAGQLGIDGAIAALGGGVLKEARDIYCKTQGQCGEKEQSFKEAFKDSKKDMLNNLEGLYYGLRHPNKDCKIWLEDLDLKTNTWKNKK